MVRFSDLLGGNDEPDEDAAPVAEIEAEVDADATDVLERLTQFATTARTADPAPVGDVPVPHPEPLPDPEPVPLPEPIAGPASVTDAQADAPAVLTPVADDLLPRGKGGKTRKGRR